MISIYTDGSCLKNPGNGGWAFCILFDDGIEIHDYGSQKDTTNNRMELTAIIEALKIVPNKEKYVIFTDSMLCINCATGKWKRKMNLDLWEEFEKVKDSKTIEFQWIKGHSGNKYNELVDKLALKEAKKLEF